MRIGAVPDDGTAFTPFEHFAPWNVDDEGVPVPQPPEKTESLPSVLLINGLFDPRRFLDILAGYVTFARSEDGLVKRLAKAHQFFAVSKAIGKTLEAVRSHGQAGVVWHTQGSGKSMEMELYANQVMIHPSLGNPTIVVLTDRTDLDDQLYETFQASDLLPEEPLQAATREELRTELSRRQTGGIIFTTLQKFGRTKAERESGADHPRLSDRRNVIVIVDEAHRSHYDDLDGYARHLRDALPYATMIAFTGTPIALADRNTRGVFGDYIDIYDLTRAVDDGATVPVYYESRLIPLDLPAGVDPDVIDERADEATAGLDDSERERIQQAVVAMNALYGAPDRLEMLAKDITDHWEARSKEMRKFIGVPGKGMIVCATRDICAALYEQIIATKPDWHCSSSGALADVRKDIAFFEEVRRWMAKSDADDRRARGESVPPDVELYLKSLAAGAVEAGGVTDLYEAAGVGRPDLSHLDKAFIERMQAQRNPHLAIEALRRLIEQEMRRVTKHNVVAQQSFSERLAELMRKYTNQNLTAAQIIAEMVEMAKDVSMNARRGEKFTPALSSDELAFYDAVAQNESAVTEMGDDVLADIARDLVKVLRRDVTTDWVSRADVRAKIRSTIKRLLARRGYPPDAQPGATELVLRQMETFADEWSPEAGR